MVAIITGRVPRYTQSLHRTCAVARAVIELCPVLLRPTCAYVYVCVCVCVPSPACLSTSFKGAYSRWPVVLTSAQV